MTASEPSPTDPNGDALERKAQRVREKRRTPPKLFAHLAHVGVLGWVFILPTVGFAYLGHLVGRSTGTPWPALVGVLAGVGLGAYLVWRNVRDGLRDS